MTVTEAETLAGQYGFTFTPRDGKPMPTKAKLQAVLEALQLLDSVSSAEGEQSSQGAAANDETCKHPINYFARFYQYLTLTTGSYRGQRAYTGLTRHDVELRTWFVPPPQIGGQVVHDMWITHITKSDGPLGFTGWYASTKGVMHYRFLNWEIESQETFTCENYP